MYKPVAGTPLTYIDNSTGNVLRDTRNNQLYVLAAGRWFRSTTEAGPWIYVPHDKLPAEFSKIPDDSPKENVKASIAGTPQAREAAISATVPQPRPCRSAARRWIRRATTACRNCARSRARRSSK